MSVGLRAVGPAPDHDLAAYAQLVPVAEVTEIGLAQLASEAVPLIEIAVAEVAGRPAFEAQEDAVHFRRLHAQPAHGRKEALFIGQ